MSSIVLDYTLADLYSQDGDASKLVAVYAYPTSRTQGTASCPLSKKFIYQTTRAPKASDDAIARRRLHNIPLKMAFPAGKMPVLFFNVDPKEPEGNASRVYSKDASEILNQLHPDQRPYLDFVLGPEHLQLSSNTELVVLNPLDRLAHLPHVVDPEVHYDLLSKRGLAHSGLPTPSTVVIDTLLVPTDNLTQTQLDYEVQRMMHPIRERQIPFIVKVPQAVGGLGTFIFREEAQREFAIPILQHELHQMLQAITPSNQHLHPCCLILQDFITGETMDLNMFVTQKGRPIFTGCSRSSQDHQGLWKGCAMTYSEQPKLQKRYAKTMDQVASFLYSKGYYGPVGLDILTDQDGEHLIVDLNARMDGAYSMGCLQGHFQRRGLSEALLYSFSPRCSQFHFRQHFDQEFSRGAFVLITWTSGPPGDPSLTLLCMGAQNREELEHFIIRVECFVSATKQAHCGDEKCPGKAN